MYDLTRLKTSRWLPHVVRELNQSRLFLIEFVISQNRIFVFVKFMFSVVVVFLFCFVCSGFFGGFCWCFFVCLFVCCCFFFVLFFFFITKSKF